MQRPLIVFMMHILGILVAEDLRFKNYESINSKLKEL